MINAVIVFARLPRAGNVKTRLAASIGPESAAAFYQSCAEHLFVELAALPAGITRALFYSDQADGESIRRWAGEAFRFYPQSGEDLGSRMQNAFTRMFADGAANVVIVGTDVPALSARHITDAIHLLDTHDVVLGPARDGGYYLLAMNAPHALFESIAWSTSSVAAVTRAKIAALGLTYAELEQLDDVDTVEAYHNYKGFA